MILRIKFKSLENVNERYYFNGELFSGVSFNHDENGCEGVVIENGLVAKPYESEFFRNIPTGEFIDSSQLDSDDFDEVITLNGKTFSGLVLEYDDDYCVSEIKVENGRIQSEVSWYKSGQIETLTLLEDNISQECEWYGNGNIELAEIIINRDESATFKFNSNGELEALSLSENFFSRISDVSNCLYCNIPLSISELKGTKSSENLYLSGLGSTDEVIDVMLYSDGLAKVRKIRLFNVAISDEKLLLIGSEPYIEKVYLQGENEFLETAKLIKNKKPDCYIEYNNQEVVI